MLNFAISIGPSRVARFTSSPLRAFGTAGMIAAIIFLGSAMPAAAAAPKPTPTRGKSCLTQPTSTPTPKPGKQNPTPTAPASSPAATPISTVTPAVDLVAATKAELSQLEASLAACASKGDYTSLAQLVTERYLSDTYAAGQGLTRKQFEVEIAPYLPTIPVRVESIDNVKLTGDGATAEVTTVVGNQLVRFKSTYIEDDDVDGTGLRWLLDDEIAVDVPRPKGADIVQIRIEDGSFHLQEKTARGPDVVLKGTNQGHATHEMLVVRLGRGVTTEMLLANPGPKFPKGVTFVGQVTVAPRATDELVLVGLRPGNYAIVCLLYDQEGNPYLASGMKAKLVVT